MRADSECALWVLLEIRELESQLDSYKMHLDAAYTAIGLSPTSSEPLSAAIKRRLAITEENTKL